MSVNYIFDFKNIYNSINKIMKNRLDFEYYCLVHSNMLKTIYCFDCKQSICDLCQELFHQSHKCGSLITSDNSLEFTILQKEIIDTEEKLKELTWQVVSTKDELNNTQMIKEETSVTKIQDNIYVQCIKFIEEAMKLKSKIINITVR